jgi:hypothetical protein
MFKIEKNVPLPTTDVANGDPKYPFADMEPGDSFFIPCPDKERAAIKSRVDSSIHDHVRRRKLTCKFLSRRVEGGVRVWRLGEIEAAPRPKTETAAAAIIAAEPAVIAKPAQVDKRQKPVWARINGVRRQYNFVGLGVDDYFIVACNRYDEKRIYNSVYNCARNFTTKAENLRKNYQIDEMNCGVRVTRIADTQVRPAHRAILRSAAAA